MPNKRDIQTYIKKVDIERVRLTLPPMRPRTRKLADELMDVSHQFDKMNQQVKTYTAQTALKVNTPTNSQDTEYDQLQKKIFDNALRFTELKEKKKTLASQLHLQRIEEVFPSLPVYAGGMTTFSHYENILWHLTDTIFNTGKSPDLKIKRETDNPLSFDLLYYTGELILYRDLAKETQADEGYIGYSILAQGSVSYFDDPETGKRRQLTREEIPFYSERQKRTNVLKLGPLAFLKEYQNLGLTQRDCFSATLRTWWEGTHWFTRNHFEQSVVISSCANPISFDLVTMASSTLPRKNITKEMISPEDQAKFNAYCHSIYPFPDHEYVLGGATPTRWTPSEDFASNGNEATDDMRWYRKLVDEAKSQTNPAEGFTVYSMSPVSFWQMIRVAMQVFIKKVKRMFKPKKKEEDLPASTEEITTNPALHRISLGAVRAESTLETPVTPVRGVPSFQWGVAPQPPVDLNQPTTNDQEPRASASVR